MTPLAQKLKEILDDCKLRGEKITVTIILELVDKLEKDLYAKAAVEMSQLRARGKARKRNEELDNFARVFGLNPFAETNARFSSLAKALNEIKIACPDVTMTEIQDRAKRHGRRYSWPLTEGSLAKYWGELSPPAPAPTATIIPEPIGWREAFPEFVDKNLPWSQLTEFHRQHISDAMKRSKTA